MKPRLLGVISLLTLILTILWLILLIISVSARGTVDSFEEAVASVAEPDALFHLTYVVATLVTLSVIALFAALHTYFHASAPVHLGN